MHHIPFVAQGHAKKSGHEPEQAPDHYTGPGQALMSVQQALSMPSGTWVPVPVK